MIDEKELIRDLEGYRGILDPENDEEDEAVWDILGEAIKIAYSQPKIGEWVPCSENLPKVKGHYLVTISDSDGEHVDTCNFDPAYPKDLEIWRSGKITAWKPKPKPYKSFSGAARKGSEKNDKTRSNK